MSKSLIEVQFPISRLSSEAYKERMANVGQTLTGLGKWWGRKPLILVRATILGLLFPSSRNPEKDMEIFLKILTMDDDGLWLRNKNKKKFTREQFDEMTYDQRLTYCVRPEEVENPPEKTWVEINTYLGTTANNLQEVIQQLGERNFGQKPVITDVFAGGGSIPFEASRIGCEVHASDLNPVAGLLTWSALNILSLPEIQIQDLKKFQTNVYKEVAKQVEEWGIERNVEGEVADYYLYCNETSCPYCQTKIPLSPSWVVSVKNKTIAKLNFNKNAKNYDIEVVNNANDADFKRASKGTVRAGKLECPNCVRTTSISDIRGDVKTKNGTQYGLRQWGVKDFTSSEGDIFNERLYCIRYVDKAGKKTYKTPSTEDFEREQLVLDLLLERFEEWQEKGYIPSSRIEKGEETSRLNRERGWNYWHQLFNPRQLLINGMFNETSYLLHANSKERVIGLLGVNKLSDWNSKLCIWNNNIGNENGTATFLNQSLNTVFNYPVRGIIPIEKTWIFNLNNEKFESNSLFSLMDARNMGIHFNIGITDPPYADAVNYHELTEHFLAWDKKIIPQIFPEWYSDSKRSLAVKGKNEDFKQSMIDIYTNLKNNMSDNGRQVIMFTHQDAKVWADLTYILLASGLQVTQAWNISTETNSGGLKKGNYVKGTVLLILQKRQPKDTLYLYELLEEIEYDIKKQIDFMQNIDGDKIGFTESDYYLSAYATALKVLTQYNVPDLDIMGDLMKEHAKGEKSEVEKILDFAKKITGDYLIPEGFDNSTWKKMSLSEKFYINGLESEYNNNNSLSSFQELARTFGVYEYDKWLSDKKANNARLFSAIEFENKLLNNGSELGDSLLRNTLFALQEAIKGDDLEVGRNWLRSNDHISYSTQRTDIINLLQFLSKFKSNPKMVAWQLDSEYAGMLSEYLRNSGI